MRIQYKNKTVYFLGALSVENVYMYNANDVAPWLAYVGFTFGRSVGWLHRRMGIKRLGVSRQHMARWLTRTCSYDVIWGRGTLSKIVVLCPLFDVCCRDVPFFPNDFSSSLAYNTGKKDYRPIPAETHASISCGRHGDNMIRTATTGVETFPFAVFDNSSRCNAATRHS